MNARRVILALMATAFLTTFVGCGGGGGVSNGSESTTSQPVTPPAFFINDSNIPAAVEGDPYSTTLTTLNGTGTVSWSLSGSPLSLMPSGLTLSANGTISGTPTTSGIFTIEVQAVDSSNPPKTAVNTLTLAISSKLALVAFSPTITLNEYQTFPFTFLSASGGGPPYTYSIEQGSLPPGMYLNAATGALTGTAIATGTYSIVALVKDSFITQDQASVAVTITISPFPLQLSYALGNTKPILNRIFSDTVVANGGTPPYSFKLWSGNLPPGLSLDGATGHVTGTPTTAGSYPFAIAVTDSETTPATAYSATTLSVSMALGRNDLPADATIIGNGTISASISPIESGGVIAPDTDYYKLVASAGSTVHVETFAKRTNANDPLDTVLELTDVNGVRLSTGCNQPGGTTNFTSPCLDDDISASPHVQDSALDYQVPGTSGTQTFLAHVLDWSGNARPDMVYTLQVSGAITPVSLPAQQLLTGIVNQSYSVVINASGGAGTLTYVLASGSLPPGLSLSGSTISGTPTTTGHYSFTIQVTDSGSSLQATGSFTLDVTSKLAITTTAIPAGTAGTPYSFQFTTTGGLTPFDWSTYQVPLGLTISSNGLLSGTPTSSGVYNISVTVLDSSNPTQAAAITLPITIH